MHSIGTYNTFVFVIPLSVFRGVTGPIFSVPEKLLYEITFQAQDHEFDLVFILLH